TGAEELGRFGEVVLATERLWQPTQRALPGQPARLWTERNLRHRVLLDDGRHASWPDPPPYLATAEGGSALRLGDRIGSLEGVVEYAFGSFRVHPTAAVRFAPAGARTEPPRAPRGALRVAAWNVENFFNGDGAGGGFPTRGAANAAELE